MNTTEFPTVTTVQSFTSTKVHAGKAGRRVGTIVTACNGQTIDMGMVGDRPANEVTCKRCHAKVTA